METKRYKLVCNVGVFEVFLQTIVWLILAVVTFGLALPFFIYAFVRLFINNTEIYEVSGVPQRQPLRFGEFPPEQNTTGVQS